MATESLKCLIAVDESFTTNDHFRRGKPPPPLGSQSKAFKEEGPSLYSVPPIDPRYISRCCIENRLFPAVLIHFKFLCGEATSWVDWVDTELSFVNQCATLIKAKVLDAVFMNKKQVVHLEPEFLHHVVKIWSIETHTRVYAWGQFTPTMEDVANIMHLPILGNVDPFFYVINSADTNIFGVLKKGASTSLSKAFRFDEWIKHFW